MACFALMNMAPSSASAADDMTFLMSTATLRMAPLFGGNFVVSSCLLDMA